eukprot:jgi/Bigna1/74777/fgenesh1_pg.31_\
MLAFCCLAAAFFFFFSFFFFIIGVKVKLMEFFDQDSSYYVLFSALESGLPRLVAVMLYIFIHRCRMCLDDNNKKQKLRFLPLFIGYALLGMLLFGSCTDLFKNLDAACVTLFSVSNGDSIEDVFQTVDTCGDPALSRFYMYSIVGLNICVVLNILLVVVEDAFFATKAFQMDQRRIQREQEAENMHLVQWLDQKTPGDTESSGDEDEEKGWGMENALSGREGHARNRKKKLMDWRLSQSSRHVPSSHTSSPRMSASLAASDVKSRMQLLRRKSFKQMFRLKAREKLRMPLKDTTPKGSRGGHLLFPTSLLDLIDPKWLTAAQEPVLLWYLLKTAKYSF